MKTNNSYKILVRYFICILCFFPLFTQASMSVDVWGQRDKITMELPLLEEGIDYDIESTLRDKELGESLIHFSR